MVYRFAERFEMGSGGVEQKPKIMEVRRGLLLNKSVMPSLSGVKETEGIQNCKMNIKGVFLRVESLGR